MNTPKRHPGTYPYWISTFALALAAFAIWALLRGNVAAVERPDAHEPAPGAAPGPLWDDDEPVIWPDGTPAGKARDVRHLAD
jgi:hypothetical protein